MNAPLISQSIKHMEETEVESRRSTCEDLFEKINRGMEEIADGKGLSIDEAVESVRMELTL